MRYNRYNPEDEDLAEQEWLAEHGYKDYPDDLPIPRRMLKGPHTLEGASRYLDADHPLPGSFPEPKGKTEGAPAWIDNLEKGVIYPGSQLNLETSEMRQKRVDTLANSGYSNLEAARNLMELDRFMGYNPLFEFQYAVLNMRKYSEVIIFKLNGLPHALHWHNVSGYHIACDLYFCRSALH